MISFDFEYYRPASIQEAVSLFANLDTQSKEPIYYGGGTEIITASRINKIKPGAVIDIKEISECNMLKYNGNQVVIGSAITLTKISETNLLPLMTKVIRNLADHTSRNKITLGGNLCGNIPYREVVLPLLVCDSIVMIAGPEGAKNVSLKEIFNGKPVLKRGEFIVQVLVDNEYVNLPFKHIKRTKQERVDYPLLTLVLMKKDNKIRAAFSGLCGFPFRSEDVEKHLNDANIDLKTRIGNVINLLSNSISSDILSSSGYREFVLRNTLTEMLEEMEGVK